MSSATENLEGQKIGNGRYLLRRLLGRGGMGAVWLAADTFVEARDVAIKIPDPEIFRRPGFRERFRVEIQALIDFGDQHGNIVKILDVGEFQEIPFAVMPYLTGGSLDDRKQGFRQAISQNRGRTRVLKWLDDVADALDYMHTKKLIHRDIKPQNILFDQAGKAYVADFGIAKILSAVAGRNVTTTGEHNAVGTLLYMPYETLCGQPIDGRADQYALAVTLFEALTGRRPYEAINPVALSELMKQSPPPQVHQLNTALPSRLSPVLQRALARLPGDRFRTCSEFADEVLGAVRGSSVEPDFPYAEVVEIPSTPVLPLPNPYSRGTPPAIPTPGGIPPPGSTPFRGNQEVIETRRVSEPAPQVTPPSPAPPAPSNFAPASKIKDWNPPAPVPPHQARPATPSQNAAAKPSPIVPLSNSPPPPAPNPAVPASPIVPAAAANWREKKVICPWCWKHWRAQDVLWVAEHPDLQGDPLLGPEAYHRFLPERFTANCRAVDLLGQICRRTACPHCHLIVPQESVDFKPIFISLLGAPTSGKTCFLTSMSWQLRNILPNAFQFSFSDADPELNQSLIENERQFFMNDSNGLVRLQKTDAFGGDRYVELSLGGRSVSFLKPYIFSLRPARHHPNYPAARQISFSVNLYDNSGESFLPGNDLEDSPVTRHLARSDAAIFVFDPSQHPRFRQACGASPDPQFANGFYPSAVRQETVLIEALRRMRQLGALSTHDKYEKPLVIVLNKFDAWGPAFGKRRLDSPWGPVANMPDHLKSREIRQVSEEMRRILLQHCGELVAAADEFSSQVTYMPVSSFGRWAEAHGAGLAAVRANQVQPMWAEMPLLWILANVVKGVIPQNRAP